MPVNRKAILIANPGEVGAENYCKGVYVDVANYKSLMTSPEGGAWNLSEIQVLDRPTLATTRSAISAVSTCDYVFIMFSGHGYYSPRRADQILELRSGEEIESNELLEKSTRRTLILDCCNKVHSAELREERQKIALSAEASAKRYADRTRCRSLFDSAIEATSKSVVRMASCAIDELSTDDDQLGGHYNSSLLAVAKHWGEEQSAKYYSLGDVLTVVTAHDAATPITRRRSGGTQNPQIAKPKSAPYFPLCVFA